MQGLTQAVVTSLEVPLKSVRINLVAMAKEDTMSGGVLGAELLQIHAYLIAGRTQEKKQALFTALNQAAHQALGVSLETARTVIHDMQTTDVGLAGGVSAKLAGR